MGFRKVFEQVEYEFGIGTANDAEIAKFKDDMNRKGYFLVDIVQTDGINRLLFTKDWRVETE